jgi:hypothetical protein
MEENPNQIALESQQDRKLSIEGSPATATSLEENSNPIIQRPRGFAWFITAASILSTVFLFAKNITVTADIQPTVIKAFGDIEKLPWISVGYELAAFSVNVIWSASPPLPLRNITLSFWCNMLSNICLQNAQVAAPWSF